MFGILKPCRHTLGSELLTEWRAHMCGLCLSLRDQHGQLARTTTNVDAIMLSVLVDAQRDVTGERVHAGPCPLRGMRTATVVAPADPGIVHGTAVSLTMASAKVHDHALDGDGLVGRVPRLSTGVARKWAAEGEESARRVSFDAGVLHDAVTDSDRRERIVGADFDHYVAPTEEAAAAACAHTAFLADRPHNGEALAELGRMFGRLTYLFDAVDDEAEDRERGAFNALVAAEPDPARRRRLGARLFVDAHARLVAAFERLDLPRPDLARALLVDQLGRSGRSRFGLPAGPGTCRTHGHAHGRTHGRTHAAPRPRVLGALARLSVAVGLQFPGFQPGVGPGGETFPSGGVPGPQQPGFQFDPSMHDPLLGQQQPKQRWWNGCCDGGDCCCCCCSCSDGCDCCDC